MNAFLLLKAHAALATAFLSTGSLLLLSTFLILEIFTSLHLRLDRLLVFKSAADHAYLKGVLNESLAVFVLKQLNFELLVKFWN